jgi:hypothetical protein
LALISLAIWSADVRAEVLNPLDFTSLGTLNLSGGSFTIDTDALTIVDNAAPGSPLFTGVIDDQRGLADSFGAGGDVTTVGPLGIPHIAVFTFDGITLQTSANITVTGHRALALLSQGDALVNTTIDVSGSGEQNGQESTGRRAGPVVSPVVRVSRTVSAPAAAHRGGRLLQPVFKAAAAASAGWAGWATTIKPPLLLPEARPMAT